MLEEFKAFLFRGNVIDLAVAVVIGVAFNAVVQSFVKNILTPLIAIPGTTNVVDLQASIGGATFRYGLFLNSVVSFVLIAAAVFFLVVKPLNVLTHRFRDDEAQLPDTRPCPECRSDIPVDARRCAFCTEVVGEGTRGAGAGGGPGVE